MSLQDFGWSPFFLQQLSLDDLETLVPARVIAMHRSGLVISDGEAEFQMALGSRWFQGDSETRPTVGDWLLVDSERRKAVRLLERKSLFKRLAAGLKVELQLIAANIDTLFIVTSCNEEFNESRLERYLALASDSAVEPVVVLTKSDLSREADNFADRVRVVSRTLAIEVVNALDAGTLHGVRGWCESGQTVALVGSSGVGKSTLVNTLAGREVQVTHGIRSDDAHGRHTTTHRSLHLLEGGGLLLDVPGLRELGIADTGEHLADVFEDVEALTARCRFVDCGHHGEPGCAVVEAIESGKLDERRLRNYEKLLREEARNSATLNERRQERRRFAKRVRQVVKEKERFRPT
jgi:ribosome biogenesis GTPase